MKLLGLAYISSCFLEVSSANEQMQINYYTDSGCSDYLGDVDVTWATYVDDSGAHGSNCYNYNYGNSVSIANCYETGCYCIFYVQSNCQIRLSQVLRLASLMRLPSTPSDAIIILDPAQVKCQRKPILASMLGCM